MSDEVKVSGKFSKERVTLMLTCSQMGGKLKPLIIGRAKRPRWLKKCENMKEIVYKSSKKAWMTTSILVEWLKDVDSFFRKQGRKILMILDNAPCHRVENNFEHIELLFLPKNTTSRVQPLDQGIIRSFKNLYSKYFLRDASLASDYLNIQDFCKKFNLSNAITIIIKSWLEVTTSTIKNCFNKAFKNFQNCIDKPEKQIDIDEGKEDSEEISSDDNNPFICENEYEMGNVGPFIDIESQESEDSVSEKEENIIGFADAIEKIQILERYFCINIPEALQDIDSLKDKLQKFNSKQREQIKITDWLIKK